MCVDRSTTLSPTRAATGIGTNPGRARLSAAAREVGDDPVENVLGVVDEVHLVHGQHDVRDPQQRGDGGVPLGLLDDAGTRVDQDDRDIGGRRPGDGVAGVLHVAGSVGQDEGPLARSRSSDRRRRS